MEDVIWKLIKKNFNELALKLNEELLGIINNGEYPILIKY